MPARSIKVWNDATSQWEDVAVAAPDTSALIANALVTTKGDLIVRDSSAPARLGVGANDTVLTADSSTATGLAWKAASSLPSQTSQAGKFLTTNGTAASWVDPPTNRNILINGAMQIAQRGTSLTGLSAQNAFLADRWLANAGLGTVTYSVETDGPAGSGIRRSAKLLVTTAKASPSAGDVLFLQQDLEGFNVQTIKKGTASAEQLTLSFWVKSNVTGTYVATLYDADNVRHVSATYTVSSSATWERKTITFPADTTGTLNNDNGRSLAVRFHLGSGSDSTSGTLATSWASYTQANEAVGQTNLAAATNNYWQVTGVQLETGPVATPFEFEPYQTTLQKCQRYYYLHVSGQSGELIGPAFYYSSTSASATVPFPVTMRTAPSLIVTTGTNFYQFSRNNGTDDFNDMQAYSETTASMALIGSSSGFSGTAGQAGYFTLNNASASVAFDAEM